MSSTQNSTLAAVAAFIATGLTFASASPVSKPMSIVKKQRSKGAASERRPASLARRLMDTSHLDQTAPISLIASTTVEDTEQAWRTVRSYFGMEIFLEFDIGTPGQTLRILIDSGSDWFWVTTDLCRACGGIKRYNHKKSATYKKISKESVLLQYGSGDATGDHIQETVCLSTPSKCQGFFCEEVCVDEMNMLGVNTMGPGLQGIVSDGLMGLSPVKIGDDRPDLFIELAYDQGAIDEKVFSLNFAGDYEVSYITFGGYDLKEFAADDITWHPNRGVYFWAVDLSEVRMGTGKNATVYSGDNLRETVSVVDSGSSYLLMPQRAFWDLYDLIQETTETYCEIDNYNTLYCTYDPEEYQKLPELFFNIDGKEYKVPRESLYVVLEEYGDLMVVEVTYIRGWEEWLFGLTFLQNYYTVYDMENQQVGFALSKSSTMAPENTILPIEDFTPVETATALLAHQQSIADASKTADASSTMWSTCAAAIAIPLVAGGLLYKMLSRGGSKTTSETTDRLLGGDDC